MQQKKTSIFPTDIWIFDNVLEDYQKKNINEAVYNESNRNKLSQSDHDLYKKPVYRPLVDRIVETSKIYIEDMKWQYKGFKITGLWSNIQKQGQNFQPHTHSNNLIRGVYYARSDKSADITFVDPRPQANVIKPEIKEWKTGNSNLWYYPSVENRLLLFPSWLSHFVPVNESSNDRVSLAFNVMLTGVVGNPQDFQSAEF